MPINLVRHALRHPPKCIAGFEVGAASQGLEGVPGMDECASFGLKCHCGSESLGILGYYVTPELGSGEKLFVGPISGECPACGRVASIMDPRQDGYDAEDGWCYSIVGEGPPDRYRCSTCGSQVVHPVAVFEYALEEEDLDTDEGLAARPQDFFTWFSLRGTCRACGTLNEITEYECA
jgi:hypothetical protein